MAFVSGVGYTALGILLVDFFITYSQLKIPPMKWLSWIAYPRYAMQALAYNEYSGVTFAESGSVVAGLPGTHGLATMRAA